MLAPSKASCFTPDPTRLLQAGRKVGQDRRLKGHCFVLAGHLYQQTPHRFRALLLGGALYLKQATYVELGSQLIDTLPLPHEPHNVVVTDRGLTSIKLAKALRSHAVHSLDRIKANATFYLPAPKQTTKVEADVPPSARSSERIASPRSL